MTKILKQFTLQECSDGSWTITATHPIPSLDNTNMIGGGPTAACMTDVAMLDRLAGFVAEKTPSAEEWERSQRAQHGAALGVPINPINKRIS